MPCKWALTLTILLLSLSGTSTYAQERDKAKAQEFLLQQEQQKRSATMREYDSAVFLMEHEMYVEADEKFKYVLANIKSVPSDLTFHFGKNSFYLGLHKQSIDWLNKYIQLKGTSGQYSVEAMDLKKKAEAEFLKEKSQKTDEIQKVFSNQYTIDCGPSGKVVCPVCRGEHVVIKKGTFGNEYRTCVYCNEHGILTCEEYNQLLRGELKPKL